MERYFLIASPIAQICLFVLTASSFISVSTIVTLSRNDIPMNKPAIIHYLICWWKIGLKILIQMLVVVYAIAFVINMIIIEMTKYSLR